MSKIDTIRFVDGTEYKTVEVPLLICDICAFGKDEGTNNEKCLAVTCGGYMWEEVKEEDTN